MTLTLGQREIRRLSHSQVHSQEPQPACRPETKRQGLHRLRLSHDFPCAALSWVVVTHQVGPPVLSIIGTRGGFMRWSNMLDRPSSSITGNLGLDRPSSSITGTPAGVVTCASSTLTVCRCELHSRLQKGYPRHREVARVLSSSCVIELHAQRKTRTVTPARATKGQAPLVGLMRI